MRTVQRMLRRGGHRRRLTALSLALPATQDELYWTARVTLVGDRSQLGVFDRVFRQVFGGVWDPAELRGDPTAPPPAHVRPGESRLGRGGERVGGAATPQLPPVPSPGSSGDEAADAVTVLAAASTVERLRTREFATLDPEELAELNRLMRRMALVPPLRSSRRTSRHRQGRLVDLRATLRHACRTAGDPVTPARRRRRSRPRRLVLLCDVSGSMEATSRVFLQLLHCAVGGARAEAFVFATRLTGLTRQLRTTDPDLALQRAASAAPDWSGGTRIGMALKLFNDRYGRRGMARGAVVVIVSDGWERDDPSLLGREMQRLSRLAHRIVWVNPRKAAEQYRPLVGGMAVALPFVDDFVSGHSLAALDEVFAAISRA